MLWNSLRVMDMQRSSKLALLLSPFNTGKKICLHSCMTKLSTFENCCMDSISNLHLCILNYSIGCYKKFLSFFTFVPKSFLPFHMCSIYSQIPELKCSNQYHGSEQISSTLRETLFEKYSILSACQLQAKPRVHCTSDIP